MILLFHILIALSSMAWAAYLFIRPSKAKFYVSFSLVGLTIASGTYLIISAQSHMLQACATGLAYLAVVAVAMFAARQKLVRAEEVA